jgi:hypothetical protein
MGHASEIEGGAKKILFKPEFEKILAIQPPNTTTTTSKQILSFGQEN